LRVPYGNTATGVNYPVPNTQIVERKIDTATPKAYMARLPDRLDSPVHGCTQSPRRVPYGTISSIREGMYGKWVKRDVNDVRVPWSRGLKERPQSAISRQPSASSSLRSLSSMEGTVTDGTAFYKKDRQTEPSYLNAHANIRPVSARTEPEEHLERIGRPVMPQRARPATAVPHTSSAGRALMARWYRRPPEGHDSRGMAYSSLAQADRTLAWLAGISCGYDSKGRRVVGRGGGAPGVSALSACRGDLYHHILSQDLGEEEEEEGEEEGEEVVEVEEEEGSWAVREGGVAVEEDSVWKAPRERARKDYRTSSRLRLQRANVDHDWRHARKDFPVALRAGVAAPLYGRWDQGVGRGAVKRQRRGNCYTPFAGGPEYVFGADHRLKGRTWGMGMLARNDTIPLGSKATGRLLYRNSGAAASASRARSSAPSSAHSTRPPSTPSRLSVGSGIGEGWGGWGNVKSPRYLPTHPRPEQVEERQARPPGVSRLDVEYAAAFDQPAARPRDLPGSHYIRKTFKTPDTPPFGYEKEPSAPNDGSQPGDSDRQVYRSPNRPRAPREPARRGPARNADSSRTLELYTRPLPRDRQVRGTGQLGREEGRRQGGRRGQRKG